MMAILKRKRLPEINFFFIAIFDFRAFIVYNFDDFGRTLKAV